MSDLKVMDKLMRENRPHAVVTVKMKAPLIEKLNAASAHISKLTGEKCSRASVIRVGAEQFADHLMGFSKQDISAAVEAERLIDSNT